MTHTYLFDERVWNAKGVLSNGTNVPAAITGRMQIIHQSDIWIYTGTMALSQLQSDTKNKSYITPFKSGHLRTDWFALNPTLGKLYGQFVIIDDVIMSMYRSEAGQYSGHEIWIKLDDTHYKNRGFLQQDDTLVSSWSFHLDCETTEQEIEHGDSTR